MEYLATQSLDSERAMNATLTAEVERLTAERDAIATAAGAYPDSDLPALVGALKRAATAYDDQHDGVERTWCSCGDRIMPGAIDARCATCAAIDESNQQYLQGRLSAALAVAAIAKETP